MTELLIILFTGVKVVGVLLAGVRVLRRVTGWGLPKDGSHVLPCRGARRSGTDRTLLLFGALRIDPAGRARWTGRLRTPVPLPPGGRVAVHRLRFRRAVTVVYSAPDGTEFTFRMTRRDAATALRVLTPDRTAD
ncbi:hypothetical protein ACIQPQ_36865 [Streptomyces sp. NPDC091281]|uniref:hypothetical protein n=1 Tax=Streptomyces sp. NPDC091281 TaxID=3365985 RepID=UPI00382C012A